MATLNNSPATETYLRLEARKSFSLGLWVKDHNGRHLDLAGTTITMVVRKTNFPKDTVDDSGNLIINSVANIAGPGIGFARFNIQAQDMNHRPGEYEYTVTLLDHGYSSVLIKGILELVQNTEFSSAVETYDESALDSSLEILLKNQHVIHVRTGPTLAPGTTSFTDGDKSKLDGIEAGAEANVLSDWNAPDDSNQMILNKPVHLLVPPGGAVNSALLKKSEADGDTVWVTQYDENVGWIFPGEDLFPGVTVFPTVGTGSGRGGLDATSVAAGYAPISDGNDSWTWEKVDGGVSSVNGMQGAVTLDADDIGDGPTKVMMTIAERAKVAVSNAWEHLTGVPLFGTAALLNEDEVLKPLNVKGEDITSGTINKNRVPKLGDQNGQSHGLTPPTGGNNGDFYFQYEV